MSERERDAVKLAAAMWDARLPGTPTLTHEQLMAMAVAALSGEHSSDIHVDDSGLTPEEASALLGEPPECTCHAAIFHAPTCATKPYFAARRNAEAKLRTIASGGREGGPDEG